MTDNLKILKIEHDLSVKSFSVMVKRKAVESGENDQPVGKGEKGGNQPAEKRLR